MAADIGSGHCQRARWTKPLFAVSTDAVSFRKCQSLPFLGLVHLGITCFIPIRRGRCSNQCASTIVPPESFHPITATVRRPWQTAAWRPDGVVRQVTETGASWRPAPSSRPDQSGKLLEYRHRRTYKGVFCIAFVTRLNQLATQYMRNMFHEPIGGRPFSAFRVKGISAELDHGISASPCARQKLRLRASPRPGQTPFAAASHLFHQQTFVIDPLFL